MLRAASIETVAHEAIGTAWRRPSERSPRLFLCLVGRHGTVLREATEEEIVMADRAAARCGLDPDGGAAGGEGVISVDGRRCYVSAKAPPDLSTGIAWAARCGWR